MILKTAQNSIELRADLVLVDGRPVAKGKVRYFFTDQPAESTDMLEPAVESPKPGQRLIVFCDGEDQPVYQSFPIMEIQ